MIVRWRGRLDSVDVQQLRGAGTGDGDSARDARVAAIVAAVRRDGDTELRRLARELDHVDLASIEVPRDAWEAALSGLDAAARGALGRAAAAIRATHEAFRPRPLEARPRPGVRIERRPVPLRRVGLYAPGGRAAYPSSVLMGVLPARAAGVDEIIVCSPPGADGLPHAAVRAACAVAGADRLFALGGAGAVAAMAFGTDAVPAVDKIFGPGNAWVDAAKRRVSHHVAVDLPAGPSEVVVIADETASAAAVAAEILAQAEHDPEALAGALVTTEQLADAVVDELQRQLAGLPDDSPAAAALKRAGFVLTAVDVDAALAAAEEMAPEHLLIWTTDAGSAAARVRNAGAVFVGTNSSVTFGDYASGSNHVLPTGGRARAFSGLSTTDFMRWVSQQTLSPAAAREVGADTATLARLEGLPAHAAAAEATAAAAADEAGAATVAAEAPRRSPQIQPHVDALRHYAPGERTAATELSDNTNLFGCSPAALKHLGAAAPDELQRYPTVYGDELKAVLAAELDLTAGHVALGCGSDDLFDATLRAFLPAGGVLAHASPTFSMVRPFAGVNAGLTRDLPCGDDLCPDTLGLAQLHGDVTYVCRPDNPSGALVEADRVRALADRCAGLLLVDEAYIEFAGEPSLAAWAAQRDDVVVLRTLSKIAGLAGLRVGYAVAAPALIAAVEKARGPYKVGRLAEQAAVAAVRDDSGWRREIVSEVHRQRTRLAEALAERDVHTWPSAANFVLLRVPAERGTAAEVDAALRERGVGGRPFSLPQGECLRVTVGPAPMMDRFLAAWDDLVGSTLETRR